MSLEEAVRDFLAQKRMAVAGVSRQSSEAANAIYKKLRGAGYQVFATNPKGAHFLSGEVPAVLEVLEAWEMPIERNPLDGDISHPALVCVLAADGTVAYTFNNPSAEWLVEAARRL